MLAEYVSPVPTIRFIRHQEPSVIIVEIDKAKTQFPVFLNRSLKNAKGKTVNNKGQRPIRVLQFLCPSLIICV